MSSRYDFKVVEGMQGKRLDVYLAAVLPEITRARFQKIIKDKHVLVNGKPAKASCAVRLGDKVEVEVPPPVEHDVSPEDIPLDVLYEDSDLIVINKAADMVVHPAAGNWSGTLVNALLAHCQDLSGVGGELKPGIVHRLDKGTSGVIVAAKNDRAHLSLSKQFKNRQVKKIYCAVVYGPLKDDYGVIENAIGRSVKDRKRFSTRTRKGRQALTEWKVLKHLDQDLVWLEIRLHTGRTHQIRVHFAETGHPLVGDEVYGGRRARHIKFPRPALHAWRLGFTHPTKDEWMEFEAPLAHDLIELIERFRK